MGEVRLRLASLARRHWALAAAGLIAGSVCALYLPFLSNPFVFDDHGLFTGSRFAEYASFPFGFAPRFPASFSVAIVQVLFGSVEAHRLLSLLLHVAVGCAAFMFIRAVQRSRASPAEPRMGDAIAALVASIGLVVHPVAVYGEAYLAQRSIVLATLFSILSATVFVRGLNASSYAAAVAAAALYSVAVLCKEQAILVAAVVPLAALIVMAQKRFPVRYALTYVAACAPAALFVFLLLKGIVGAGYQTREDALASEGAQIVASPWGASVLTQLSLFPRYVALWLWPDTDRMSFDLRVDFAAAQSFWVAAVSVIAFVGTGLAGAWLLKRRGRAGMLGFGILWFWVLYLIEFSVARFQEPFVLYRSYLWAPGIAIALAAVLERLSPRIVLAGGLVVALTLGWQAHDRLRTFSSGLALWADAVAKLPPPPIPGGARPLYQLGREYFYAGETEKALAVVNRCIADYPGLHQCLFARAAMLVAEEQYEAALPSLAAVIAARPGDAVSRHHLGLALERLGCREEAKAQYQLSAKLGFWGGVERLKSLEGSGGGILPASRTRLPSKTFSCSQALKGFEQPPR